MNVVAFRLGREPVGIDEATTVTPVVDGRSLIDHAHDAELGPATQAGEANLAGHYAGLVVTDASWPDWFTGVDPHVWFGDGDTCLLGCVCGDVGCWPLTARITFGPDEVVWSGFRTGHRAWDLRGLGPFRFDAGQYRAALGGWTGEGRRS